MSKAIFWLIAAAVTALAASCKSAPAPAASAPAPAAVKEGAAPLPETELARARELKAKADRYSLGDYVPDEYAAASKDLQTGEEAYGKDNKASKSSLDGAIDGFETVLSRGGDILVAKLQERSSASKAAADELKASVAVKEDYARALEMHNSAIRYNEAKDLEQAGLAFERAVSMFDAVAAAAREKRDRALQAMKVMEQGMTASEEKAQKAQQSLEDEGLPAEGEVPSGGQP